MSSFSLFWVKCFDPDHARAGGLDMALRKIRRLNGSLCGNA
jgi:hypothetical protein